MNFAIKWVGDSHKTSVFFTTMPFFAERKIYNLQNWVDNELGDYLVDQPEESLEYWALDCPARVLTTISNSIPLSNVDYYSGKYFFDKALGFHENLDSHEIVAISGIYAPLDRPFLVSGVGYAGVVAPNNSRFLRRHA